jgi:hypothetical protein
MLVIGCCDSAKTAVLLVFSRCTGGRICPTRPVDVAAHAVFRSEIFWARASTPTSRCGRSYWMTKCAVQVPLSSAKSSRTQTRCWPLSILQILVCWKPVSRSSPPLRPADPLARRAEVARQLDAEGPLVRPVLSRGHLAKRLHGTFLGLEGASPGTIRIRLYKSNPLPVSAPRGASRRPLSKTSRQANSALRSHPWALGGAFCEYPGKHLGPRTTCARRWTPFSICCAPPAGGAICPATAFRRAQREPPPRAGLSAYPLAQRHMQLGLDRLQMPAR